MGTNQERAITLAVFSALHVVPRLVLLKGIPLAQDVTQPAVRCFIYYNTTTKWNCPAC